MEAGERVEVEERVAEERVAEEHVVEEHVEVIDTQNI